MDKLTKAQIVAANDLITRDVEVPEWGGAVTVRMLTGAERDAFEASLLDIDEDGKRNNNLVNMRAKLVALAMVDEAGSPMFGLDEVDALGAKSAAALERVFKAAHSLNGMSADAVKEAEKNSAAGPAGASSSS